MEAGGSAGGRIEQYGAQNLAVNACVIPTEIILIEQVGSSFLASDGDHADSVERIRQDHWSRRSNIEIIVREALRVVRNEVIHQRERRTHDLQLDDAIWNLRRNVGEWRRVRHLITGGEVNIAVGIASWSGARHPDASASSIWRGIERCDEVQ